jgi:hypothetical protein
MDIVDLYWHQWIAGTQKHGYRHQNFVSISLRNRVMAKKVISPIWLAAILKNGDNTVKAT